MAAAACLGQRRSRIREDGAPPRLRDRGVAAHYGVLETLLAIGVRVVADGTMYEGEMEQSVRRLRDLAEVINVHCSARDARARFERRQRGSGRSDAELSALLRRLDELGERVVRPLDLGCFRVDVKTDEGYDPDVDRLLAKPRVHLAGDA